MGHTHTAPAAFADERPERLVPASSGRGVELVEECEIGGLPARAGDAELEPRPPPSSPDTP